MVSEPEIVIIEDAEGLVVLGDPTEVEPWLRSQGMASSRAFTSKAAEVASATGRGLQLGSELMASSGRWVKLTKESAELVGKGGNSLSGGVIRSSGGKIIKHVKFEDLGKAALANPGMLAGVGGLMAQMALEQSLAEITDYLSAIDAKVDDLLRDQKVRSASSLVGIGESIDEAKRIRDTTGVISSTTWSKVAQCGAAIAEARSYALSQLGELAAGLEKADDAKDVERAAKKASADVQDWLVILARTIQLQDELWIVELERVIAEAPHDLDAHRAGLMATRQANLGKIETGLNLLAERVSIAAQVVINGKIKHPIAVKRAVGSLETATHQIATFANQAGVEARVSTIDGAPTWRQAVGSLAEEKGDEVQEFGQRALDGAKSLGTSAASTVREIRSDAAADVKNFGAETQERVRDLAGKLPEITLPSKPKIPRGRPKH